MIVPLRSSVITAAVSCASLAASYTALAAGRVALDASRHDGHPLCKSGHLSCHLCYLFSVPAVDCPTPAAGRVDPLASHILRARLS